MTAVVAVAWRASARYQPWYQTERNSETFGLSDKANLDEGAMWPTSFALKGLTTAEEARIGALVKKALS